MSKFSALSWQEQVTFLWDDDDVHFGFVLNKQFAGRHECLAEKQQIPIL
jgi:hypothetical protein